MADMSICEGLGSACGASKDPELTYCNECSEKIEVRCYCCDRHMRWIQLGDFNEEQIEAFMQYPEGIMAHCSECCANEPTGSS